MNFSWTFTMPAQCDSAYTAYATLTSDIDGLVTVTKGGVASSASGWAASTLMQFDFTVQDGGSAASARSRDFNFGIEFRHVDGDFTIPISRRLIYSNPCD